MTRTYPVHPSLKTGWSQRELLIINRRNKFLNADPVLTDMSLSTFRLAGNTVFPAEKPVHRARLTGFLPETPDGSLKLTSRRLRESFFRWFAARIRQKTGRTKPEGDTPITVPGHRFPREASHTGQNPVWHSSVRKRCKFPPAVCIRRWICSRPALDGRDRKQRGFT